jgi:hypothetical protein
MNNNSTTTTKPSKLAYLKALKESFNKGMITKKIYKAERKFVRSLSK